MKERAIQIHRGFEILAQRELGQYVVYLSTSNISGKANPSFKIIENAPSCVRAIKKAQQLINEMSWEPVGIYASMEILIANGPLLWMYKITPNENTTIIQGGFEEKIDAIQSAFIMADKELQKLQKQ